MRISLLKKIAVIGNGGGGKTTLSRRLAELYSLPITHVDSIQFLPGMVKRPVPETTAILNAVADGECWLIDGFGALAVIERRFALADKIIFVDFPLWRHYWWCTKRQLKVYFGLARSELPEGCDERGYAATKRLFKILWRVHYEIRPEFLRIFARPENAAKLVVIRNVREWSRVFADGFEG